MVNRSAYQLHRAELNRWLHRFEAAEVDVEAGLALHGGVGYEWRLTPGFAFAPRMELNRVTPGGALDSFHTFSLRLTGTWY